VQREAVSPCIGEAYRQELRAFLDLNLTALKNNTLIQKGLAIDATGIFSTGSQPSTQITVDPMILKELYMSFVLTKEVASCGVWEVRLIGPTTTALCRGKDVVAIRATNHSDKTYFLMGESIPTEMVFGVWKSSQKSVELYETMTSLITSQENTVLSKTLDELIHVGDASELKKAFKKAFKHEVSKVLDDYYLEHHNLIKRLKAEYPKASWIRDEANSMMAASPLGICQKCGAFKPTKRLRQSTISLIGEDGFVVEDVDGSPKESRIMACDICHSTSLGSIYFDEVHQHAPLLSKLDTTFEKWPFERSAGVELETLIVAPIDVAALKKLKWRLVGDGSIKNPIGKQWKGVEFNSPPASGDGFLNSITEGMKLWARNSRVNESCGFHVHVDWSDLDVVQQANCQNFLVAMDRLMFAAQPPSRSSNNFCKMFDLNRWKLTDDHQILQTNKYQGINFNHAVAPDRSQAISDQGRHGHYGTVEFRMGAGTRNVEKVLKWVEFCQRLIEIGGGIKFADKCRELRHKTISQKLQVFKELSQEMDSRLRRPPEFLNQLMPWLEGRIEKFSGQKVTKEVVTVNYSSKKDYQGAVPEIVHGVDEVYENQMT
jgi:hypothetical protein